MSPTDFLWLIDELLTLRNAAIDRELVPPWITLPEFAAHVAAEIAAHERIVARYDR